MYATYLHPVTAQLFYFNKKLLGGKRSVLMIKIPKEIMLLQSSEIILQGSK